MQLLWDLSLSSSALSLQLPSSPMPCLMWQDSQVNSLPMHRARLVLHLNVFIHLVDKYLLTECLLTLFTHQSHYFHTCVSGNWNSSPAAQPCITGWSCGSLCVTCSRPAVPDCPTAAPQLPGPDHCYDRKRSNSCCPVCCLRPPQSHFAPDTHQDQHTGTEVPPTVVL